jgi:hypothetical protein
MYAMVNINLTTQTNTANSFSFSGVTNPIYSYALGILGIEIRLSQVSLPTWDNGCTVHKTQHPRADEDSHPQCRCSSNKTPDILVIGMYGISDIHKMRVKRMDMQVILRAVNVFLHFPTISEWLLDFKHFIISLVSVRHVILFCIFIDKHAFIFY